MHNLAIGTVTRFITGDGVLTGAITERTQTENYAVGYWIRFGAGDEGMVHVPSMNIVAADDDTVKCGGRWIGVSKAVAKRIRIETRIAKSAIAELLSAGYTLGVYDGEETTIKQSTDKQAVLDALQTTDDDYLLVYKAGESKRCGWVRFVYGNDGWDVISDYTVNLEDALTETNKLADTLSV